MCVFWWWWFWWRWCGDLHAHMTKRYKENMYTYIFIYCGLVSCVCVCECICCVNMWLIKACMRAVEHYSRRRCFYNLFIYTKQIWWWGFGYRSWSWAVIKYWTGFYGMCAIVCIYKFSSFWVKWFLGSIVIFISRRWRMQLFTDIFSAFFKYVFKKILLMK